MIIRTHNLIEATFDDQIHMLWASFGTSESSSLLGLKSELASDKSWLQGLEEGFENNHDHKNTGFFAPPIAHTSHHRWRCL